jgi:acyl phosphate:glycerol-3-phosphate acyltransferase
MVLVYVHMLVLICILCGIAGYVLGSIPFGFLIAKAVKGIDIRTYGSGRTGGTNVYRAAGLPAGIATAMLDVGKGALAVTIARALFPEAAGWAESLTGIGVILGHNYSCFLGFRGGAGGATAVGTGMALWWAAGVPALLLGCVMVFGVGYASLATLIASLSVAIVFTLAAIFRWENFNWSYAAYGWTVFTLCVIALRPNIERLRKGTEKRVQVFKRPQGQGG